MSFAKLRDIFKTSSTLLISQVLNFLFIPLIARAYKPEVYAEWALFYSFALIIGGIATARYSDSIVLLKRKKTMDVIVTLCFAIGLFASCVSFVAAYLFGKALGLDGLGTILIPLSVLLMAFHMTFLQVLVREGRFSLYSFSLLTMSVFPSVSQLISGWFIGASSQGIILAGFIGQCISALTSYLYSSFQFKTLVFDRLKIFAGARRYSRFPKFSMGFAFFSLLRVRAMYLIFGAFRDPVFLGCYAQTDRLLSAPSALLGASIRPIFFRHAANVGLAKMWSPLRLILKVLWIGFGPILGVILYYSNDLVVFLLGRQWKEAGWIFQALVIPSFLLMTTNWLDRAYDVLKLQKRVFLLELFYGSIAIIAVCLGVFALNSIEFSIYSLGCILSVYYVHWLVSIFSYVGASYRWVYKYLLISFVEVAGVFAYLYLISQQKSVIFYYGLLGLLLFCATHIVYLIRKEGFLISHIFSENRGGIDV
ncbi:hypothetical protein D3C87_410520 [compost metagenome]